MAKSFWMDDNNQTANYSNNGQDTFNPDNEYIGLRLQQGVPLLDRDWNEMEDIRRFQERVLRKEYIGDGCPDGESFRIQALEPGINDFRITPGRYLVHGLEAVNKEEIQFSAQVPEEVSDTYTVTAPTSAREDLVYLEVWLREVRSTEEETLGNLQDVDVETSVRHKVEWRVRLLEDITGANQSIYNEKNYSKSEYHFCTELARIIRTAGTAAIMEENIEDRRRSNLSLSSLRDISAGEDHIASKDIIEADGTTGQDTNRGNGIKTAHIQDGAISEHKLSQEVQDKLGEGVLKHNHDGDTGGLQINHGDLIMNDGENPHQLTLSRLNALDAGNQRITGISFPLEDNDAVCKAYTDQAFHSFSSIFDYTVKNQDDFNMLFEQAPGGDNNIFQIKVEYKSVFIKTGNYSITGAMTGINDKADSFLVLTNQCTLLFCEPGVAWDYAGLAGGLHVNTEKCKVLYLTVKGDGSALAKSDAGIPSFRIDAKYVSLTGCQAESRNCIGFRGSSTNEGKNVINRSSSLEACVAVNLFQGDYPNFPDDFPECATGFLLCGNLNRCLSSFIGSYTNIVQNQLFGVLNLNISGFHSCYSLNQCSSWGIGLSLKFTDFITPTSNSTSRAFYCYGFYNSDLLTSCKAFDIGNLVSLTYKVIGDNHFSEFFGVGFGFCENIINSKSYNNGNLFTHNYDSATGDPAYSLTHLGLGFENSDFLTNCTSSFNGDDAEDGGMGFSGCKNITSCSAYSNGNNSKAALGIGFYDCHYISSSAAIKNGNTIGYGLFMCDYISTTMASDHPTNWYMCSFIAASNGN